jgi:transcriptional regulator with XRE-family HTH domain
MVKRLVRGVHGEARDDSIWIAVGERLRTRRSDLGLSADSVAEELGIAPDAYADYESGAREAPALVLAEIASLYGVPVLWLFQDVVGRKQEHRLAAPRSSGPAPSYRVATVDERVGYLAECFRKLDLEGQQHLLAIAAELTRPGEGRRAAEPESRPRRAQRMSSWQYASRKSK